MASTQKNEAVPLTIKSNLVTIHERIPEEIRDYIQGTADTVFEGKFGLALRAALREWYATKVSKTV